MVEWTSIDTICRYRLRLTYGTQNVIAKNIIAKSVIAKRVVTRSVIANMIDKRGKI